MAKSGSISAQSFEEYSRGMPRYELDSKRVHTGSYEVLIDKKEKKYNELQGGDPAFVIVRTSATPTVVYIETYVADIRCLETKHTPKRTEWMDQAQRIANKPGPLKPRPTPPSDYDVAMSQFTVCTRTTEAHEEDFYKVVTKLDFKKALPLRPDQEEEFILYPWRDMAYPEWSFIGSEDRYFFPETTDYKRRTIAFVAEEYNREKKRAIRKKKDETFFGRLFSSHRYDGLFWGLGLKN